MPHSLPAGIPSIEERGYNRESLVDALSNERTLPSAAIAFATMYADAIEPDVIAVLERAQREDIDVPSGNLLFRGIHILGGRRCTAAYRPLVTFLNAPPDRVETLLGEAVTENLSQILAGLFDGDAQPLWELVANSGIDPYIRDAAMHALAFLTFDRRIDRTVFEAFLLRFDEERLAAAEDDVVWHAWMTAVAVLGMTALETRVRAAFADGRIPPDFCDEDDFDELLKAAIGRPDDRTRLTHESMGYIDDVLVALEKFGPADNDDFGAYGDGPGVGWLDRLDVRVPFHNKYRDVGRNDPCPCGSGKKFKKCCLQA